MKSSFPRAAIRCSPRGTDRSSRLPIPTAIQRPTGRSLRTILSLAGRSITPRRARVFLSASPIGGARRNRAIPPTAVKHGRNSPPRFLGPAHRSWGERSPPAQPKTSSGRPRVDRSLTTRSTGVRPGPRSRFPASRVGAVSTGSIISISGRSPPTGCWPTPFIFTIPAKECSRPPTGARVGRTCILVTSKAMVRWPVSTRRSCPFLAKPAIFSTLEDRRAAPHPPRR